MSNGDSLNRKSALLDVSSQLDTALLPSLGDPSHA